MIDDPYVNKSQHKLGWGLGVVLAMVGNEMVDVGRRMTNDG